MADYGALSPRADGDFVAHHGLGAGRTAHLWAVLCHRWGGRAIFYGAVFADDGVVWYAVFVSGEFKEVFNVFRAMTGEKTRKLFAVGMWVMVVLSIGSWLYYKWAIKKSSVIKTH